MFHGQTKRGVSTKSTVGMRSFDHSSTWLLVADRSRLRLFEQTGESSSFELRRDFVNPDGRKKGHELMTDRPGRSFDSQDMSHHGQTGGARHTYSSSIEPKEHVSETLVTEAVKLIENSVNRNEDNIFVLAEPRLTGLLRPALEKAFPKTEVTYFEKDYAWLDTPDLEKRLNKLVR